MITLHPPAGEAPFKAILLHSGTTYRPDFSRGGIVKVSDEEEARELEREGWVRDAASAKAAAFDRDLLRKAMSAEVRRMPGVGDFDATARDNTMTMAEFDLAISGEKIRIKRGDRVITVAGVELPIDSLPAEVRRELNSALARLDGASFDTDANLVGTQEARRLVELAIMAVMASTPFRDRLITAGTKRAAR